MTLRKLRLQARYNVLTPAALIGVSSALLMSAPALAAAQTNTGISVVSILVGSGNAFTNTGSITSSGGHPAVYSNTDVESIFNAVGASIVGNSETGVYIDGDVTGAFTNNGTISSNSEAGVDVNGAVDGAFTNTGTISGTWAGVFIRDGAGSFANSGTVTSVDSYATTRYGVGINSTVGSFTNSGTISESNAYDGYGVHINGGVDGAFVNTSTISASSNSSLGYGAYVSGSVGSFANSGSISSSDARYGAGVYITGSVGGDFTNSGTISSSNNSQQGYGVLISNSVGNFLNSGTISVTDNDNTAYGVYIGDHADSFTNSGTISATDNNTAGYGVYIGDGVDSFVNTGHIDAYYSGVDIYGSVGSFVNTGTITSKSDYGVYFSGTVTSFSNSGTISGTYGVYANDTIGTFTNSGTITGSGYAGVYISADDTTVVNSGKISGNTYSVRFNGTGNTLKVLTGGSFVGNVLFGSASDMFDFSGFHGNMILGVANNSLTNGNVVPGDNLYLQTTTQVIVVGDSSVTNASHPVSDITNGINNLITNQLDFETGGGDGGGAPLGFAPVRVNSAAEMATAKAMAPKVSDGPVFWAQGTAGGSSNGVDASDVFGALVVGTHAQLQDGLRIGGLGAYAHSIATTDGSQTITADTGIIGAYGRAELDTISLDFSILAGASTNASARTVAGPGGPETASATFGGWFINPTVGVSVPVLSSDKGDLSLIGTVGYLFGGFGGYTETGSSANLTVGAQTIGILDAAFGVKGKKDLGSNEHGVIVGKGTAEVFAESNMGSSTVPISVLGTTIGNALPPTALALGVRSSLSVEVPISDNVSLTGGGSVSLRTDGLISGAATAKISGTF